MGTRGPFTKIAPSAWPRLAEAAGMPRRGRVEVLWDVACEYDVDITTVRRHYLRIKRGEELPRARESQEFTP